MSLVRFRLWAPFAGIAHLVERHLAKVEVASSSLVARSRPECPHECVGILVPEKFASGLEFFLRGAYNKNRDGDIAKW